MARSIVVNLDPIEYRRLSELALAQDRDPWQQARHLLRSALATAPYPDNAEQHASLSSEQKGWDHAYRL